MLKINQMELGPVQTNCYLISNEANECLIFDPGAESRKVVELLRNKKLNRCYFWADCYTCRDRHCPNLQKQRSIRIFI